MLCKYQKYGILPEYGITGKGFWFCFENLWEDFSFSSNNQMRVKQKDDKSWLQ